MSTPVPEEPTIDIATPEVVPVEDLRAEVDAPFQPMDRALSTPELLRIVVARAMSQRPRAVERGELATVRQWEALETAARGLLTFHGKGVRL